MYLEILEQRAADYVRQPGSLEFVELIVDDPHVVHNLSATRFAR